MKKTGILNAELAAHVARLGHTDRFLVVDSGFPVPPDVPLVDLRLVFGVPPFARVLDALLAEVAVESALIATELAAANPRQRAYLHGALPDAEEVAHDELKRRASGARFAVRTAEDTPYSNAMLTSGVAFPV